jgi:ABC-2 type transport system ATP-binding protein
VSKRYGQTEALKDVTFTAAPGEILALWGANGAGKTTLLKAILSLIRFDGDIAIDGHSVQRAGKQARRGIGYVPQEAVFYDWGVLATMRFYARLKKRRRSGSRRCWPAWGWTFTPISRSMPFPAASSSGWP